MSLGACRVMIADIFTRRRSEAYGRTKEITPITTGLVSYHHLTTIKPFLAKEMQGGRGINQQSFLGGTAVLMHDYGGKTRNIADELTNRKFTGFRLEPTKVTLRWMDVKAVLEK
ncbi:MAG: hypothetical protein V2B13_11400 [Pseudomonadota bacterium]